MKSIRLILLGIFAFICAILQAQVIEWHRNNFEYLGKNYFNSIDSIVFVPAQDWSIKLKVDSFYVDSLEKVHVVATAHIGPDAHVVLAAIGNYSNEQDLVNNSIRLEAGKTIQTIDFEVPNPQSSCALYVATKNKYNESQMYNVEVAKVDYVNRNWTPWTTTKKAWVAAGYDAEDWPLSEDQSTCTYYYTQYWSGADAGLRIAYRMSLLDPTIAQFRISNWGGGVDMYINYNPKTHKCVVPEQFSGAVSSSNGDVAFGDVSAWLGADYSTSYPCTYDPKKGLFTLNVAYYVSAGAFGYGVETCQVDGFYLPDYSVEAKFKGVRTDSSQVAFAQLDVESIGVDAEKAVALIVTAEDDAAAVADALAAGEARGTDLVVGYNNIAIEEDMRGELQIVVCTVSEGAAMDVKSFKFEYYAGGANPWKSLGIGLYTEGIVSDMYGIPAETYEVEITENTETPGVYRVMNPYGEQWSYAAMNTQAPVSYLEIHAENPNAVYILPQMLGVNMEGGDTELGFASLAGYFYATGQASLEELATLGYMGKVVDGNILLPTFEKGTPGTADYFTHQGVVYYGSTKAYNAANGFKVVLPDAVSASDLSKIRKNTRRAVNFNRVRTHEIPKKITLPKLPKSMKKL